MIAKKKISNDLMQVTLCHGLRNASFELWNATFTKVLQLKEAKDEKDKTIRDNLITALGCSNNQTILENYLSFAFSDDTPQLNTSAATVIKAVYDNSEAGVNIALNFITNRIVAIFRKIPADDKIIRSIFTEIGEKITTSAQLDKLNALLNDKKQDIPNHLTQKGIEAARNNIEWLEKSKTALENWRKVVEPEHQEKDTGSAGVPAAPLGLIATLLIIVFSSIH
jgi:hypothetical protein